MKYNCMNQAGEFVGTVCAQNAEQALERAQDLNKDVTSVEEREGMEKAREPKEK